MAFARTQKGAIERVKMKRAIRLAGDNIASDATTKLIRKKYLRIKKR